MSVHSIELAGESDTYEVRWRDPMTRQQRARRYDRHSEAFAYDLVMKAQAAKARADAAWEAIPADVRRWAQSETEQG